MSFDDDLAQMHADCDEAFGKDATFRPVEGAPVEGVKVERFRPEPMLGFEGAKTPIPDELLRVQKSALPRRPMKGDVFEIGDEDLRVIETPIVEDDDAARWTVKVAKVRS